MCRITRLTVPALCLLAALLSWDAAAPAAAPPPSEAWLDRLVAQLGAEKFEAREAAARSLEAAGSAAVPALRRGLDTPDLEVRKRALALLKRAEARAAAYFEALGAWVQRPGGRDRVEIVSYSHRDPSKLRDEHLRELAGFPWLKRVLLKAAPVGDAGMVHVGRLTNLDYLDLSGTRVTDAGLAHLADLTNVEVLDLNRTRVAGPGLAHLSRLTKLIDLQLVGTDLTDAGLASGVVGLKGLAGPCGLSLSRTRLTDTGLRSLKQIKVPVGLFLGETRVTDRGVALLKTGPELFILNLADTAVTDEACAHITEMKSLVKVSFDGTRVTAAGLRRLRVLPRLRQMSFSKVKLAGNEYEDLLDLMPRRVELLHDRRSDLGRAAEKA